MREVVMTIIGGALLPIVINHPVELIDLTFILTAKVAGKQMKLQLDPPFKTQAVIMSVRDQETRFVACYHMPAHENH
jgi:hypothetical protein